MIFQNVDLEIQSACDLAPLAAELDGKAMVLYCDDHFINLESGHHFTDANDRINDLCGIIESLSPAGRELWRNAIRREFDAGFETPRSPGRFAFAIPAETLRRMTNLNASLAITIYPPGPDGPPHE